MSRDGRSGRVAVVLLALAPLVPSRARPQRAGAAASAAGSAGRQSRRCEIYGFGQADAIVDFKQNNPDWFDVNRPSQAARRSTNQFGHDGHFYLSARQSRFGVKGTLPTDRTAT